MSYRCSICRTPSEPGQPRRVHTIYRIVKKLKPVMGILIEVEHKEIAREIPVCQSCWYELEIGTSLKDLLLREQPTENPAAEAPQEFIPPLRSPPAKRIKF